MDKDKRAELIRETEEAIRILYRSGTLARNEEEERLLAVWRAIPEDERRFSLGFLAGLRSAKDNKRR